VAAQKPKADENEWQKIKRRKRKREIREKENKEKNWDKPD